MGTSMTDRGALDRAVAQVDPRLRLGGAADMVGIQDLLAGLTGLEWPGLASRLAPETGQMLDDTPTSWVLLLVENGRVLGVAVHWED